MSGPKMRAAGGLVLLAVLLPGCAANKARQAALKVQPFVKEYDAEIEKVKKAEMDFYSQLADNAKDARETLLITELVNFRLDQSTRFADLVAADPGKNATRTELFDFLTRVTDQEFELYKSLHEREAQARTEFLGRIESLNKRNAEIDLVEQTLLALGKKSKPLDDVIALASFIQGVGGEVKKAKEAEKAKQ